MHINQRRKRRDRKLNEDEEGEEKKAHTNEDGNHQRSRSYDADTQAHLNTSSLAALTLEPCPTPIKHLKAFVLTLPQINNIPHPAIITGANI